ncbi:MAG: RluA family pseudouridine synthase [Verrucomicrobia bacterium]|nr:RluA family pseudouridine synthase [Verrucomicrobiota bacterium]
MAKPKHIEIGDGLLIPILYEDRSALAIDKPPGWLLAPDSWDKTARNLQLALLSSINAGDFWARSRNLRFLRFVHRLDADTSGVLLLAKSPGSLQALSRLFETRQVEKVYWAVVEGIPKNDRWVCKLSLAPDPVAPDRMRVVRQSDARQDRSHRRDFKSQISNLRSQSSNPKAQIAKPAETHFRVLNAGLSTALIEARPSTGRTHQIRVHLAVTGHPVVSDVLYGSGRVRDQAEPSPIALRAVKLAYHDPFTKRRVEIRAPTDQFTRQLGF